MYETPYVNNKIHGLYKWWYNNGKKCEENLFKNDFQHAVNISFNY